MDCKAGTNYPRRLGLAVTDLTDRVRQQSCWGWEPSAEAAGGHTAVTVPGLTGPFSGVSAGLEGLEGRLLSTLIIIIPPFSLSQLRSDYVNKV